MYQLFDLLRVPSKFVGAEEWLRPDVFRQPDVSNVNVNADASNGRELLHPPFNRISKYRVPGLVLTAMGRAMEDGVAGQPIRIMNVQSKAIVHAVVTGPDTVLVQPNEQLALN